MGRVRRGSAVAVLLTLPAIVGSQAPPAQPAPAPPAKPAGSLNQIMRGVYFPNANLIFDVQQSDPGAPRPAAGASGGVTDKFATVYSGWEKVEYAAVALVDGVDLLLTPGRLCHNGTPVPVERADYQQFARNMRTAGLAVLQAAHTKDQEKVSDATNDLTDACSGCHGVFRSGDAPDSPTRCTPALRK